MPTDNRRIATYFPKDVDEKFTAFKLDRGIRGDSQALLTIVSEFLGVTQEVAYSNSPEILLRVENIEKSLLILRGELFQEVKQSVLLALSKQKTTLESPELAVGLDDNLIPSAELLSKSESESLNLNMIESLPTTEIFQELQNDEVSFLASDLAKRLGAGQSTISNRKRDASDVFTKWTSARDPDGLSWMFNTESGMFSPIGDVPADIKVNLIKTSPKGLTNRDLAKRLNIDGSTLSHWKKSKSSEEMLQEIRSRDPDGIGWIFNSETGRFVEEISSSPRMTQSELPGMVSPVDCQDF